VLKLGSLREIGEELGSETKTNDVKRALLQNASVFIMAKIEYVQRDGGKKTLEANFTRYQIVLTGEDLLGDRKADAVYVVLNPIYYEIVSQARVRPVDYRYLTTLKPLSQRFYELISPSIYGAVNFKNFTNILYSDFCLLAPAVRQKEQWLVKKQLNPVITPHIKSGYIEAVYYQPTVDRDGMLDWIISLKPGALARGHATAFSIKRSTRKDIRAGDPRQPTLPFPIQSTSPTRDEEPTAEAVDPPGIVTLIEALVEQGINAADAERLARTKPDECRRQLEFLPFHEKPRSKGAFLRSAIQDGFGAPAAFEEAQERLAAEQRREEAAAERRAHKIAQEARRSLEAAGVDELITQLQAGDPDAFQAFSAYVAEERQKAAKRCVGMNASMKTRILAPFDTGEKRRDLFQAWQAERSDAAAGSARSRDAADVERKHVSAAAFRQINAECESYNAQRSAAQPELTAVGLIDEWLSDIRRIDHKIADVDKSFTDFALEKLYRDA
jgi:cation transport regulator ChaB